MKKFLGLSIVALTILFLFVGCRDDGSSGVAGVSNTNSSESSSSSTSVAVPEPATLLLLGSGLLGLAGLRKRFEK